MRRTSVIIISLISFAVVGCLWVPALNAQAQQAQAQSWTATGSLATARFGHTATLLANGKVLITGGRVCGGSGPGCTEFSSAEIYDPASGAWSFTGSMSVARHAHVAVRLLDRKVLVAGGLAGASTWDTAEIYDPDTGVWSATGGLAAARAFATATLLASGKVLVTGGGSSSGFLNTAEVYDPATGVWSPAGTMNASRGFHTATLLANGRVLVTAGAGLASGIITLRFSADIYDPATGSWTATGSLGTARVFHTSTLLPDGNVLVTGGSNFVSIIYDTAELYDPATGQWSATGRLTTPRNSHAATLLANGKVLAVAGFNNEPVSFTQKSTELYDPATGAWTASADLNVARGNHAATLLPNGNVLVSGGNGGGAPGLASAELYDNSTALPQITGASISGKALYVEGQNFDEGAKVYLNDEKQKTANETSTTLLRCKKAGKQIERGTTVRLKVRNSDGTESAEFFYTRPAE
jgi:hypothetical protein